MLDARMLSEQAWRQEEEPVKVAIQNYKNLDLWVLGRVGALERLARTVVQENNSHTCPPLRNSRNIMIM